MIAKLLRRDYFQLVSDVVSQPLRMVGVLSYSLYLLHGPFVNYVPSFVDKLPISVGSHTFYLFCISLGMLFPIITLATLWYKFLEIPSISLGKRCILYITGPKRVSKNVMQSPLSS